jgi:hypothetical protein
MVSFTRRPHCPQANTSHATYALKRRLGGINGQAAHFRQERFLLFLQGIEPQHLGCPANRKTIQKVLALLMHSAFKLVWQWHDDWAWLSRVDLDVLFHSVLTCFILRNENILVERQ